MLNVMEMHCNALHVLKVMLVMCNATKIRITNNNALISKIQMLALQGIVLHICAYLCMSILKIMMNCITEIVFV